MGQNWVEAEKKVKKALECEFKISFTKQKLIIGKNSNGKIIKKEFDLVSEDKKIVVEVKSYKLENETTKKSGYTTTRKWRLIGACFYLSKVKGATNRILALTNKELYSQFIKDIDGLIDPKKNEVRHIP